MKETDIIAEINKNYVAADTPIEQETSYGISWMIINVLEVGKTADGTLPIAKKRNIAYYVKNRGQADEEAWFMGNLINTSSEDPVTASKIGNELTSALYKNEILRDKVLGQICSSARAIFWEDALTVNHAERIALAIKVLTNTDLYVKTFMAFIALDDTIRSVGGKATDIQIENVINGWWTNISVNM